MVVDNGGGDHQDVEELVRVEPDVTLPGEEALRDAKCVEHRARDVQHAHEYQTAKRRSKTHRIEPVLSENPVDAGHDARQPKGREDAGTQRAIVRHAEALRHGDDDGENAKCDGEDEIEKLGQEFAIESVVEPWHEGARDEERDAAVVELRTESPDTLRVARESVVSGGQAQTDDGAREERPED